MKPEILLSSGRYFNFRDPDPEVVTVEVIAGSLSKMCRFTGHVSRFYSVAEHSVRCSYLVPDEDRLEALMHDAAEAFIVDLPSPLKAMFPEYKALDNEIEQLVAKVFDLRWPWPPSIKRADLIMLATERRDLMPPTPGREFELLAGVTPDQNNVGLADGSPGVWERMFLARFKQLVAAR